VSGLRDPLAVARGLGSAKGGTSHWWLQRLTSVVLFFLTPWFLIFALGLVRAEKHIVQATLAQPLNATLMVLWLLSLFWHAQLGLQVVIEDYVHTRGSQLVLQVAVKFLCFIGAAASVLAILKIALGR
jgi:succinate dehydrogenase / fumarate reductase membrane anchor subunit